MFVLYYLLLLNTMVLCSLRVSRIVNATYSTGVSFSKTNFSTPYACICACDSHPHCLSISITKLSTVTYYCQLYATYPFKSSQLTSSSVSNVTVMRDRTMNSVYINNGTTLSNPTNIFSNNINPWIPVFKLFTGNNQSFLWFNSSNSTTLTDIPKISINQTASHWYSILISQWNQNSYKPSQVAMAFIVNRSKIFDFLIYNASQSNITSWHVVSRIVSSEYWTISNYKNTNEGQEQLIYVFTDSYCIRSFNANFKFTTGCDKDFYGFYFVRGGYKDTCLAAVRNISKLALPTIYYTATTDYTSGSLDYYSIADGIMIFVR